MSRSNPAQSRVEDQPRPALGLRPWFALLRRARNLRRFALAIRTESVTAQRGNLPIDLIAEVPGVFRCPVVVPMTFRERLAGIKRAPPGHGVLLAASAVNSIGVKQPLTVIALDDHGRVLAVQLLAPNKTWRHPRAGWMVELDRRALVLPGSNVQLLGRDGGRVMSP